jgi:hypothetical protein
VNNDLDPILLNLNVPLIDAVCASVCGDWFAAADLWFEVCRDPRYRPVAVQCGAEAALQAGLLDLAEFFYLGLHELPKIPDFVTNLRERSAPIRRARTKYYSQRLAGDPARARSDTGQELMRLHFFREAVRFILVSPQFREAPSAVVPLLARAYWMLGAHASLICLYETHQTFLSAADLSDKVSRARRLLSRRSEPPMKNVRRFQDQHPAGRTFSAIVEGIGSGSRSIR